MRHLLQLAETEKSACAFDGVNSAKYASQSIAICGILLQLNKLAVQSVQVLVALRKKILHDIAVAHRLAFRLDTLQYWINRPPSLPRSAFCTPQPVWRLDRHGWPVDLSPVFLYIVRSEDFIRSVKPDRLLVGSFPDGFPYGLRFGSVSWPIARRLQSTRPQSIIAWYASAFTSRLTLKSPVGCSCAIKITIICSFGSIENSV